MSESLFIDKQTLEDILKYCPPLFKRESDGYLPPERPLLGDGGLNYNFSSLYGWPITVTDQQLVREEWTPPRDPFIEFEPKDYGWLRKLGFGTTVKVRTAYLFDNRKLFSTALIF